MTKLTKEETWKPVPGFEPYEASSYGRIRNPHRRNGKTLNGSVLPNGYHHIVLGGKKNYVATYFHRLVCLAFNGPCPNGMECCHLDGNRLNNCPENLIWGTHKTNMSHAIKHGTTVRGERNGNAKLTRSQINFIRSSYSGKRGEITRMAERFGVRQPAISHILLGQRWSHPHG